MNAIKALYRDPDGYLWSALPTRFRLGYSEGKRTTPWHGKLLVFLESDLQCARQLCLTAATWYFAKGGEQGSMEIWQVECRNLYLMRHVILAMHLAGLPSMDMRKFWDCVNAARDPAGMHSCRTWVKLSGRDTWATDWLVPLELIESEALSEIYGGSA